MNCRTQVSNRFSFTGISTHRPFNPAGREAALRGEKAMSMTDARLAIPLALLGCLVALPAAADTTFLQHRQSG